MASRFSILGNDVDLDDGFIYTRPVKKETKADLAPPKSAAISKPNQKTVKKKQELQSLQDMAFCNPKASKKKGNKAATTGDAAGASATKKVKSNGELSNGAASHKPVSEDWRSRDNQFVDEENERALREALMVSKLEHDANRKTKEDTDKGDLKGKKKKKDKPITISLSEFNNMDTNKLNSNGLDNKSRSKGSVDAAARDDNFFADVDKMVRNTITKENRQKLYNAAQKEKAAKNGSDNDGKAAGPTLVPLSEVEKRDFEIQALRLEVESLKSQLEKVKLRNKKLCEVFGAAEMRSMGEIVVELGKVSKARDEFSAEVASLSEQLEQEKTKVSQLQEKHRKK